MENASNEIPIWIKYGFNIRNIGENQERFHANFSVKLVKCKDANLEAIFHKNIANMSQDRANTIISYLGFYYDTCYMSKIQSYISFR